MLYEPPVGDILKLKGAGYAIHPCWEVPLLRATFLTCSRKIQLQIKPIFNQCSTFILPENIRKSPLF